MFFEVGLLLNDSLSASHIWISLASTVALLFRVDYFLPLITISSYLGFMWASSIFTLWWVWDGVEALSVLLIVICLAHNHSINNLTQHLYVSKCLLLLVAFRYNLFESFHSLTPSPVTEPLTSCGVLYAVPLLVVLLNLSQTTTHRYSIITTQVEECKIIIKMLLQSHFSFIILGLFVFYLPPSTLLLLVVNGRTRIGDVYKLAYANVKSEYRYLSNLNSC